MPGKFMQAWAGPSRSLPVIHLRKLLEHPDDMVAGPTLSDQRKAGGSSSTSDDPVSVIHCPIGFVLSQ